MRAASAIRATDHTAELVDDGSASHGRYRTDLSRRDIRLGDADTTYWFLHRALGWDVVLQLVWVMNGPIAPDTLALLNRQLAAGRLHRRLIVPRMPGARPVWTNAYQAPALVVDHAEIDEAEADDWAAEEMATVRLDAEAGRCWRLRAIRCASGATVISLCALHLVADGRTLVTAAAAAMAATDRGAPAPAPPAGAAERRWSRFAHSLVSDARDAAAQVHAAAGGLARVAGSTLRGGAGVVEPVAANRAPIVERSPQARWARATASVPTSEWDRVAANAGGTANSLFIATVTGLLRSSGYAPVGDPIKVGIPVDRRDGEDDPRTNATAGVSIVLTDEPVPGGTLHTIRRACKQAFVALAAGQRPAIAHLQSMVWLIPPAWLVGMVTAGDGMPDAMVSNLGAVPAAAGQLDGATACRFVFRGMAQGVDPDLPYRFGDGVQSWLTRTDDRVTFAVFGCDEEYFDSDEHLRTLLDDELTAWGLVHEVW